MNHPSFSIIYQDHHMLIVNKAAGIVMHPTYKHVDGDTFWDALLIYLAKQGSDDWQPPELPDELGWSQAPVHVREMLRQKRVERLWQKEGLLPRPCLLHRLDKDTSGVAAIARTERACRHLVRQFYDHTIEKRYVAVVQRAAPIWATPRTTFTVRQRFANGNEVVLGSSIDLATLGDDELVLDGPLQRDPDERRRCIVGPDGQEAKTIIKVLAREQQYFLLEARPVTGRTHQIRAHLAALGYSIIGDRMYGVPITGETEGLQRQFLHAYSLKLQRYPDNAECQFVAPLADDLVAWMKCTFPTALGVLNASTTVPN